MVISNSSTLLEDVWLIFSHCSKKISLQGGDKAGEILAKESHTKFSMEPAPDNYFFAAASCCKTPSLQSRSSGHIGRTYNMKKTLLPNPVLCIFTPAFLVHLWERC